MDKIKENKTKVIAVIGATVVAVAATVGIVKIARNRKEAK